MLYTIVIYILIINISKHTIDLPLMYKYVKFGYRKMYNKIIQLKAKWQL